MNRLLSNIALTPEQLTRICLCTQNNAERFVKHLNNAMEYYDINTPARVSMFLSQMSFDSYRFSYTEENLAFSTKQLMRLYPARFPTTSSCEGYALNPRALASLMYKGKYGNDDPGDAWMYRPRGLWRLIGKTCYHAAQDGLGMVVTEAAADRIAEPQGATWSSAWMWCSKKINEYADKLDLPGAVTAMSVTPVSELMFSDPAMDDRNELWEYAQAQILDVLKL